MYSIEDTRGVKFKVAVVVSYSACQHFQDCFNMTCLHLHSWRDLAMRVTHCQWNFEYEVVVPDFATLLARIDCSPGVRVAVCCRRPRLARVLAVSLWH